MKVALNIEKDILRKYIFYLFPKKEETGLPTVSYSSPLGKQLLTFLSTSDKPVAAKDNSVVLELPRYGGMTNNFERHFLYYDAASSSLLNYTLESLFDVDFRLYYAKGVSAGLMKKEIIDAFIFSRGLSGDVYDALHKRIYRQEIRAAGRMNNYLRNKADYIDKLIDTTGLK